MQNLLYVEHLSSPWRRAVKMWNKFILLVRAVGSSKKNYGQNWLGFKGFKNGFDNNFFCLRVAGVGGHWRVAPRTGASAGRATADWRVAGMELEYIIPVLHDVHYSCLAWCILFLFGMMYIIPVWYDVYYSCLAWCILFLYCLMYIIPVWHDVYYSCFPRCTLFLSYIIPVLHVVP